MYIIIEIDYKDNKLCIVNILCLIVFFLFFLQIIPDGTVVVVIVWWLNLQLRVQSVPITTKVVSLNRVHVEMYSMQYYVIKFLSDLRQVGGFLRILRYPPSIKLTDTSRYNWNIFESGVKHHKPTNYNICIEKTEGATKN